MINQTTQLSIDEIELILNFLETDITKIQLINEFSNIEIQTSAFNFKTLFKDLAIRLKNERLNLHHQNILKNETV